MNNIKLFSDYERIFKKVNKKTRQCLVNGCKNNAIKSHALQKKGILKEISSKNHIYQFSNVPLFLKDKKGNYELKKRGINDVFTFPGFCALHDTSVFSNIETNKIQANSIESARLHSYRAISQEIRRKEIAIDLANDLLDTNPPLDIIMSFHFYKKGLLSGIENLNFFKNELEKEIFTEYSIFEYQIVELPKIEVCISAPLTIKNENESDADILDENGNFVNKIITTNILNIFPIKNKTLVLLAQHPKYPCDWSSDLINELKNSEKTNYKKIISDIISTRAEFWCISPKLYESINKKKKERLLEIWKNEVLNFSSNINNDFNFFE